MDDASALQFLTTWFEHYKEAWESRDAEKIIKIFALDAEYWETPFLLHKGHEQIYRYWQQAPGTQQDISFGYKIIQADKGLVHWTAQFISEKKQRNLDGIFMLEFNDKNQCTILREWWHVN